MDRAGNPLARSGIHPLWQYKLPCYVEIVGQVRHNKEEPIPLGQWTLAEDPDRLSTSILKERGRFYWDVRPGFDIAAYE